MKKLQSSDIKTEICVDSVEGVLAARLAGADRVELCSALLEGGLTPTIGMAKRSVELSEELDVMVMIRPRGGDFLYSDHEFEVMKNDVKVFKNIGVSGFVFGILNSDGSVDSARTEELIRLSRPLPVTFHRAFDMVSNPFSALTTLIEIGVDRLLTSGLSPGVIEGAPLIKKLIEHSEGKIVVMPGGDITEQNVSRVIRETTAKEIHFAALESQAGPMKFQNTRVFMGGALRPPEYQRTVTTQSAIARVINALSQQD